MELRAVVLGGMLALQKGDDDGVWSHVSIKRCENIPSGVYTLHNAAGPEPGRSYTGSVLAQHEGSLYQLVGKCAVRHPAPTEINCSMGDKVQLDYGMDLSRPSASVVERGPVLEQMRIRPR